jgi:hypothetical protein
MKSVFSFRRDGDNQYTIGERCTEFGMQLDYKHINKLYTKYCIQIYNLKRGEGENF